MDLYGYRGHEGDKGSSDPYDFELTDDPPLHEPELPPTATSSKPARGLRSTSAKWGAISKTKPPSIHGRARAGSLERDFPKRRASQSGESSVLSAKTDLSFEAARQNAKNKQGSVEERVAARLAQLEKERESKLDESMLLLPKSEDDNRQLGASLVAMAQPISMPLISAHSQLPAPVASDVELERINISYDALQNAQAASAVEQASFASVANLLRQSANSSLMQPSLPISDMVDALPACNVEPPHTVNASSSYEHPYQSASFATSIDAPWRSLQVSEPFVGVALPESLQHSAVPSSSTGTADIGVMLSVVDLEAAIAPPRLGAQDISARGSVTGPPPLVHHSAAVLPTSFTEPAPSKHAVAQSALAMALRAAASSALGKALKMRPQPDPCPPSGAIRPKAVPMPPPEIPSTRGTVHTLPAWQRFLATEQLGSSQPFASREAEAQSDKLSHITCALDSVASLLRETRAQTSSQLSELQQAIQDASQWHSQADSIPLSETPRAKRVSFVAATSPMSPRAAEVQQPAGIALRASSDSICKPDISDGSSIPAASALDPQPFVTGDWKRTLALALWHVCVLQKAADPSGWMRGPASRIMETEKAALSKDTFFDDLGTAMESLRRGNAKAFVPLEVVRELETTTTMLHGMVAAYEADNVALRKEVLALRQQRSVDISSQAKPAPQMLRDIEVASSAISVPDLQLQRKFDSLLEEHRDLQSKHACATQELFRESQRLAESKAAMQSLVDRHNDEKHVVSATLDGTTTSILQPTVSDTQTARELSALRAELSELHDAARANKSAYETLIASLRQQAAVAAASYAKELENLSKELGVAKRRPVTPAVRVPATTVSDKSTLRISQLETEKCALQSQVTALQVALRKAKSTPAAMPPQRSSTVTIVPKSPVSIQRPAAPAAVSTTAHAVKAAPAIQLAALSPVPISKDSTLTDGAGDARTVKSLLVTPADSEEGLAVSGSPNLARNITAARHATVSREAPDNVTLVQDPASAPVLHKIVQTLQERLESRSIELARAEQAYNSSSALLESKISEKYETVLQEKDKALAVALLGLQQFAHELGVLRGCQT
jgi:hypothetical protein